jgi:hypothetical protein
MLKNKLTIFYVLIAALGFSATTEAGVYEANSWLFSVHGGFSPAKFNTPFGLTTHLTNDAVVPVPSNTIPNRVNAATISATGKVNYNKMHRNPHFFGLDIGYMLCDNWEAFIGYEFLRVDGKSFLVMNKTLAGVNYVLNAKLKSYDAHLGYMGVRKYFDCHGCFLPFVGLKLGGSQNKQGMALITVENGAKIAGSSSFYVPGYFNTIGFVGGPQMGVDYRINKCWSAYVAAEILYKTSHYCDTRQITLGSGGVGSVKFTSQVTQFGTNSWAYPVSFGIRYKL